LFDIIISIVASSFCVCVYMVISVASCLQWHGVAQYQCTSSFYFVTL